MSNDSKNKQNDKFLEGVNYVEHRMMFLGHSFTKMVKDKSINFSFSDYSDNGEKIVIEGNDNTRGIINKFYNTSNNCENIKNYINCERILYNFLNNGCVSIVIYYEVYNIDFMLHCYQKIAGENFIEINKTLFIEIKDIIENDAEYKECFEFIKETKYGIPEKFLENNDTSFVTDTMVYSQHFIMKENNSIFLEKVENNKDIEQLWEDIDNSKKEFENIKDLTYKPLKFGWGIRYWEEIETKCLYLENSKLNFLDAEFLFLSRQVLVNSQIIISTEVSNKIIFNKEFSNQIDIEDLELFICVYKIFHQKNDLMLMDFNEDTKLINSALFKYDDFKDLEESKNNSEDTIIKILNNYQTKQNKISTIVIDIILIIIAALTIYSVTHDFFQFTDLKIPNEKITITETITKNENGNKTVTETTTENGNGNGNKTVTETITSNGNKTVTEIITENKTNNGTEFVTETKKEIQTVNGIEIVTETKKETQTVNGTEKLIFNATFNPTKMLVLIIPTFIIFLIILYVLNKKYKIRIFKRFKTEYR
ncbi:hypothetical protein N5T57_09980 [Aliarcobacter cryaerophilus]|uniref:hypothetical protein n=1 Tax=Aliarcobacter cryaerophilus TaxID=28198 RepID=UPI0021B168C5|nr:hypothetical protein [Aliarcobacter cryaerophilus]MCT7523252.1 hypothetical protein [Aliarcobacter cryaerophilus]